MTTRAQIDIWLDGLYNNDSKRAKQWGLQGKKVTHMVVACDEFDWSDYPIYVTEDEDVNEVVAKIATSEMNRVMEVYSANHSRTEQLDERRARNLD